MIIRLDSCPRKRYTIFRPVVDWRQVATSGVIFFCFQFGGRFWQVKMYVGYYSKFKNFSKLNNKEQENGNKQRTKQ